MAFVYEPLQFLLLLAFSTCCLSSTSTTSTTKPQRLVSKLIHPGSVHHPHYNPNATAKDRMELDMQHSDARLAYIQARIEGSLVSNDYKINIFSSKTRRSILANISIGQPPSPQLVVVDTGSDIFWVMCTLCSNCYHHVGPLFDPSKSSTYIPSCITSCDMNGCKCTGQLPFHVVYADRSFSSGKYGRDILVFETTDEGTIQIPNIEFGCCNKIRYGSDPGYNGVLGLNNAPQSLASQIGHKFSYCIGNLADEYYSYNQLILGEGADLEGFATPFQVRNGFYYITMEGISIGEKRLDIDPAIFEMKKDGKDGVIIDSGTTLTFLTDVVYEILYEEVRNLLGNSFRQVWDRSNQWLLCYVGFISTDLDGFPVVTFHFADGADLALDSGSFFTQLMDHVFCMNIAPTRNLAVTGKPSLIGLFAQQSYNVGYDLVNHNIYFQRIDCALLSG